MPYSSALHLVRGVKSRLTHSGVAADALFEQAGLTEEGLACDALTLSDRLSHLWELVVAQSGDPLIGLKVSTPHRLGWLGVMGHIMLVSPTVQSTIERCHGHTRVGILLPGARRAVPLQRYDFVWCVLLRTLRSAAGRDDATPVQVEYAFPEPANACYYEETFGCPVHFNRPYNVMEFADADLVAALPEARMPAAGDARPVLASLARAQLPRFSARVQDIVATMLPKGPPHRDAVAARLMMSERTLQRRLAEEGTSFSALVDETRRELARRSLESGDQSLKMLSFQLGFSEPSAFYRACKRWFGTTPSDLAHHGERHAPVKGDSCDGT
ncbi:AraC family transcriptional regulator [Pseudoduganella chitinolytica]|uniref:AraC family transcriptional regulator ligand-binding domain-containing protein n=1 Tax=Pseudoduganella chitinolytica TaxID=34070 RepID=A0ABY8B411_9BURK|nr:AraC family transcriptional regulator [Pseudoduganella chitinolytica]WEF30675.1 AraC family transcriptional regulator ligand-binding domain-containing protein [Pseudoduganella chitinolytica]